MEKKQEKGKKSFTPSSHFSSFRRRRRRPSSPAQARVSAVLPPDPMAASSGRIGRSPLPGPASKAAASPASAAAAAPARLGSAGNGVNDEAVWKRLKEAGFDEESIRRRDKAALIAYVAKLEGEVLLVSN